MKKPLATCCLLLSLGSTGCDVRSHVLQPSDAPSTEAPSRSVSAASMRTGDVGEDLRGDALLFVVEGNGDVVVALDRGMKGETPDGVADQVYRLQRDETFAGTDALPKGGLSLRNATLRFDSGSLHVRHPDFSALLFVNSASFRPANEVPFSQRWSGYGLARTTGKWSMDWKSLSEAAARGFQCGGTESGLGAFVESDHEPVDDGSCAAGGGGSSSCSIGMAGGECSVACTTGYYACCNVLGGCRCVAY